MRKTEEHFENIIQPMTLECMVQCDNSFKAMYDGQEVGRGDNWQQVYRFSIPNIRYGTKVYFYCSNLGGSGYIKAQFKMGNTEIFSNISTLRPLGKMVGGLPLLGNRYVGCMTDNASNRDLAMNVGEMSRDECLRYAYNNNMAYYALQNGSQCWLGNSFGRWGTADNCNKPCVNESREKCGGSLSNQVYAVNQPPSAIEVKVQASTEFDTRAKALWVQSGDDSALGTWIWELTIPDANSLEFCPDINYSEFNPAACREPQNPNNCAISAIPNYRANNDRCVKKFDYSDPDRFYITLNRLFNDIIKNTEAAKSEQMTKRQVQVDFANNENPKLDNCNCDKDKNGIRNDMRAKYKTLIHYSNPKTYGSVEYKTIDDNTAWLPHLKKFMIVNQMLNRVIVIIAKRMDYPLDNNQMIDENHAIPNTPMYYSLIKLGQKYSETNHDALSEQFKANYRELYDLARIITGIPKFVRECNCLPFTYPGTRQCVPC